MVRSLLRDRVKLPKAVMDEMDDEGRALWEEFEAAGEEDAALPDFVGGRATSYDNTQYDIYRK